jgi:hypothetical protein
MRAAKVLAVLAIAALGIGSFSAVALAGKTDKRKTGVFFSTTNPPTVDESGKVTAQGEVHGYSHPSYACSPSRSMRLQLLDTNGVVLTTLDASTTGPHNGRWTLSGQLPTALPVGTHYLRVKAKRRTVPSSWVRTHPSANRTRVPAGLREYLCLAGFSPTVAIPAV